MKWQRPDAPHLGDSGFKKFFPTADGSLSCALVRTGIAAPFMARSAKFRSGIVGLLGEMLTLRVAGRTPAETRGTARRELENRRHGCSKTMTTPYNSPIYADARAAMQSGGCPGLFDFHCDVLLQRVKYGRDVRNKHEPGPYGQGPLNLMSHCDLVRMKEAGYGAACVAIHSFHSDSEASWQDYLEQIALFGELCGEEGTYRVRRYEDWAVAAGQGHLAMAPAVEGAHMLNGRDEAHVLEKIQRMAEDGVVYVTLAHTMDSMAASCSFRRTFPPIWNEPDHGLGLTGFGLELIEMLIAHGIAVDLAHVCSGGLRAACLQLAVKGIPALCTHGGLQYEAGCDQTMTRPFIGGRPDKFYRNLSRDDTDALLATGGCMGFYFAPMFLGHKGGAWPNDSKRVVDHMLALAGTDLARIDRIAIGTDYDGFIDLPDDQRDCRDVVKVVDFLMRVPGMTLERLQGVLYGNAIRTLGAIWAQRTPSLRP